MPPEYLSYDTDRPNTNPRCTFESLYTNILRFPTINHCSGTIPVTLPLTMLQDPGPTVHWVCVSLWGSGASVARSPCSRSAHLWSHVYFRTNRMGTRPALPTWISWGRRIANSGVRPGVLHLCKTRGFRVWRLVSPLYPAYNELLCPYESSCVTLAMSCFSIAFVCSRLTRREIGTGT